MKMYISSLWPIRYSGSFGSKEFFKYWLKRVYHIRSLLRLELQRVKFRKSRLGNMSVISSKAVFVGRRERFSLGTESFVGAANIHLNSEVVIGNFSVVNDGVRILTASHAVNDPKWRQWSKPVIIGDNVWIAMDSIILPGVTIGDGVVVGAGSVVTKSIEPYSVVAGNPAKVIRQREVLDFTYSPVRFIAPFEAWVGKNIDREGF